MKHTKETSESYFLKVMCKKCKNEQVVFSRAATVVKCTSCEEELAMPTGGMILLKGKKIQTLT